MKVRKLVFFNFIFCLFFIIGCSSAPIIKDASRLPPIVKAYKHITLYRGGPHYKDTGIYVRKGDIYSILPRVYYFRSSLSVRIGEKDVTFFPSYHNKATSTGPMYIKLQFGMFSSGTSSFSVDILLWEREDWDQIVDFLERLQEKDRENETLIYALDEAERRKKIYVAETSATKEIEETKKELEELRQERQEREEPVKGIIGKGKAAPGGEAPNAVETKEKRIKELEARLGELSSMLAQLQEMKKDLAQEREKTSHLTKALEAKEKREKELLTRLKDTSKAPPVIVIASPKDGSKVEANAIRLAGVAEDEQGIAELKIFVNDKPLGQKKDRGLRFPEKAFPKRLDFSEQVMLEQGENEIKIRAIDSDGLSSESIVCVNRIETRKNIWAVVIGINNYPHVRHLKYAVNDARMFYDYLVKDTRIPPENVALFRDQQATLSKIKSALGTDLKNKAGKEDMVIIFFAGHGATETDVMSPDGDGLEKYLLPFDAEPKDLYATALPMGEISRIFGRIRSERLIFIADCCYSGASGGRTIDIAGIRATISEAFLDRIAGGKGRVIMTASGANEVSAEVDELQHGVFSYYLVEGLRGRADADRDGLISVDEVYRYVSEQVPKATGQEQHPVKKGTVEGRLIMGIVH